jgi:hypothetical protein
MHDDRCTCERVETTTSGAPQQGFSRLPLPKILSGANVFEINGIQEHSGRHSRQFNRFQISIPSFPSFGRGFDSHRPLHNAQR